MRKALKLTCVCFLFGFFIVACAPENKSVEAPPLGNPNKPNPPVDEKPGTAADPESRKLLLSKTWCQHRTGNFAEISWYFRDDLSGERARVSKTTNAIERTAITWELAQKKLRISLKEKSVPLVDATLSFNYDTNSGTQMMTWTGPVAETETVLQECLN